MPDIGLPELLLIAIVGLLVIGPDRLPETLRTLGLWLGRMRRSFNAVKTEIEKEIGMDEVKRQLHNEAIMDEMKRIEAEVKGTADVAKNSLNEGIQAANRIDGKPAGAAADPGVDGEISDLIAAQDGGASTATADDRDHTDAGAEDDRDHTDAAAADDRNHSDAGAEDDRDHTDAGADDVRDHTDAGAPDDRDHSDDAAADDRDPTDAGAEPTDKTPQPVSNR